MLDEQHTAGVHYVERRWRERVFHGFHLLLGLISCWALPMWVKVLATLTTQPPHNIRQDEVIVTALQ